MCELLHSFIIYHLLFDMNEGPGTNAKTAYPFHGNKFQKS